ncbi:PQQ-binding-like beta-propeller repeat protein, partial [Streptomyces sp. NPDC005485]|uniref:PQQ-binding-like beta-propeller repeat protein n=1 Tax=Streptomyces sp. NPDC005485 TaxID=3155591 RepID=UPI0033BC6244
VDGPPPRRGRARRRLVIAAAAGAVLLAATASVAVVRLSGDDPVRSDLPAGWTEWHAAAKGSGDATGTFSNCGAVGTSLVCAGDDVKAARFSLATGKGTWSLPVDSTPDDSSSSEGSVLGTHRGRVYVYANDEAGTDKETELPASRYSVQSLNPVTGKVAWKTRTGDGGNATAPDLAQGGAVTLPEGIVAVYGNSGRSYALLDADTGKVRWKQPMPAGGEYCVLGAAAHRAYLLCQTESMDRTSLYALDNATGRRRWSVSLKGSLGFLGQDGSRLILAPADGDVAYRDLTTVDITTHRLLRIPLSGPQPAGATLHLTGGTLYFSLNNGSIRAVSPRTGRQSWEGNSTVEYPGPPLATTTHLYVASPSGRLAAMDLRTGKVDATRPGRDEANGPLGLSQTGAPLLRKGDALYVPYGRRSVYTVDVRHL